MSNITFTVTHSSILSDTSGSDKKKIATLGAASMYLTQYGATPVSSTRYNITMSLIDSLFYSLFNLDDTQTSGYSGPVTCNHYVIAKYVDTIEFSVVEPVVEPVV